MTIIRAAEAFHPGEFLLEELDEQGWSQADFAVIIDQSPKAINDVINGRRAVSASLAVAFSKALGSSAEYWLKLQTLFDLWNVESDDNAGDEIIAKRAQLFQMPVREMARRGWIEDTTNLEVLENELSRHFDGECRFAARRRNEGEPLTNPQAAWLYRAKHVSGVVGGVAKYSEKKLRAAIDSLRGLLLSPEDVVHVPRILSEAGVRLIVVEGLPGLKAEGVCFWLSASSPVVLLSMRFDRIDNFWFVLRHELEHVLRGDGKGSITEAIPDSIDTTMKRGANVDDREQVANSAASDFCVPELEDFISRMGGYLARNKVAAFAQRIGVHPGLVVGQLHFREELPYSNLRRHLVKVRQYLTETAMTDGWGILPQLD